MFSVFSLDITTKPITQNALPSTLVEVLHNNSSLTLSYAHTCIPLVVSPYTFIHINLVPNVPIYRNSNDSNYAL